MNQITEEALNDLVAEMARLDNPADILGLFQDLLTPTERQTLALRWLICQRLLQGVPQRTIAAEFGVSLCKITRGSSEMRKPNSVAKRILANRLSEKTTI